MRVHATRRSRCRDYSGSTPRGKDGVDKTALSESDICDRYITPALEPAGWLTEHWRREYGFTDGKMIVRGSLVARGHGGGAPAGPATACLQHPAQQDLETSAVSNNGGPSSSLCSKAHEGKISGDGCVTG